MGDIRVITYSPLILTFDPNFQRDVSSPASILPPRRLGCFEDFSEDLMTGLDSMGDRW